MTFGIKTWVKSVYATWREPRLSAITRAVVADRLTYLSREKLARIELALRQTAAVPGEILEFGVALGGSGIILAENRNNKRFIGFDLFGTIPAPTSEKDDELSIQRYKVIASGQSQGIDGDVYYGYRDDLLAHVTDSFAKHGVKVDGRDVELVQGLFENTLPLTEVSSISMAHLDCDWYDPVKLCLNYCRERIQVGGIIVVDDYYDYGGCRVAIDEFLAANPNYRFEDGPNPFLRKKS